MSVGEETKVPNASEPAGEHMQQKASQELIRTQGHPAFLVSVRVIPPPESDHAVVESYETMVGNGYPMRIARQVLQDVFGSAERPFCVHDPFLSEELPHELVE
jgi:hypothetical protein